MRQSKSSRRYRPPDCEGLWRGGIYTSSSFTYTSSTESQYCRGDNCLPTKTLYGSTPYGSCHESVAEWAIAPACSRPEPLAAIGLFPEHPGRDQWAWGEDWPQMSCSPTEGGRIFRQKFATSACGFRYLR